MSQQPITGYQPAMESGPVQWFGGALSTFEDADWNPFSTWGEEKSNWGKGIDAFLNIAADVAKVPWGVMTALGTVQQQVIDRPIATILQATNVMNPLYHDEDGVQWTDLQRMWNASESEMGVGRSLAMSVGGTFQFVGGALGIPAGQKDGYANYLSGGVGLDPDFNPYAMTPEQREQLNNNAVYNIGTGLADLGYDIGAGVLMDKGVGAFRRVTGLARNARSAADIRAIEDALTIHQDPINPEVTAIGRQADTIAATRDVEVIRAQPVAAGIRTPGVLYALQQADDPVRVGKILRAARGDIKAISELTTDAPEVAWNLTSADRRLSEALGDGYRIAEDPTGQLMIEAATEGMFKSDPSAAAMRDLFWQKNRKTGEFKEPREGDLGYVPRVETTRIPAGVASSAGEGRLGRFADTVAEATGASRLGDKASKVQADIRGAASIARGASRADLPDTGLWATRLIGIRGVTPMVRLITLAGEKLPSQVISLSPNKPEDAAEELIAQTRDMSAWRPRGNGTVTFHSAKDGSLVSMTRYQREADIRDRILVAQAEGGEQSVLRVIREIERENLDVLFLQKGRGLHLDEADFDRIVESVVSANGKGHGKVSTDDLVLSRDGETVTGVDTGTKAPQRGGGGYYVDGDGTKVEVDPQTLRGLANSWVTLPMRQIEDTLITHAKGLPGVAKSAVITGRQVRDATYGIARASMLMRLGYIPKNSMADPVFARMLALGEVFGPDGSRATLRRFGQNTARRTERAVDALGRALIPSRRISTNERRFQELKAQRDDYRDEMRTLTDEIAALRRSTDPISAQLLAEAEEKLRLVRQGYNTVVGNMDGLDARHRLEPISFDALTDIEAVVKQWSDDMALSPEEHLNDVLFHADRLFRAIQDHTDAAIAAEDGSATILATAWKAYADGGPTTYALEDLIPHTLGFIAETKRARLAQRVEVEARLQSIGVPPMPLIQRMIQDFERYAPQYGILPDNWDTLDFDTRSALMRDWLAINGDKTPWGKNYPLHRIDQDTFSETDSALNMSGYYSPASILADSDMVQPGMRLYRAMSQSEYDSMIRGHVVDGEPLAIDTSLPIMNSNSMFWSVEGLGREGQQQGYWWTGLSPEKGGGFGSFYDNPEAPIVVEVVVTDPSLQVVGRKEVSNRQGTGFADKAYTSNIGGDWEKRTRPGSYVQVLRAWKAESPTGRTPYDDERVPINMEEGATPDDHWTELDIQKDAHTVIDIERYGQWTTSHRVGSYGQIRRTNGGSWQRELEQIDADLMELDRLETAIDGLITGDGEKIVSLLSPSVMLDEATGEGVVRFGSASAFSSGYDMWGAKVAPKQWSQNQRATFDANWDSKDAALVPAMRFGLVSEDDLRGQIAAAHAKRSLATADPADVEEMIAERADEFASAVVEGTGTEHPAWDAFVAENDLLELEDMTDAEIHENVANWFEGYWQAGDVDPSLILDAPPVVSATWDGNPIRMVAASDGSGMSFVTPRDAANFLSYRHEFGAGADVPMTLEKSWDIEGDFPYSIKSRVVPPDNLVSTGPMSRLMLDKYGLSKNPHPLNGPIHTTEYLGAREAGNWWESGAHADWLRSEGGRRLATPAGISALMEESFRRPVSHVATGSPKYGLRSRGQRWTEEHRDDYDVLTRRRALVEYRIDQGDPISADEIADLQAGMKAAFESRDFYRATQQDHKARVAAQISRKEQEILGYQHMEARTTEQMAAQATKTAQIREKITRLRTATLSGNGRIFVNPETGKVMHREDWTTEEAARAGYLPAADAFSADTGQFGTGYRAETSMSHTYEAQNDPFYNSKVRRREERLMRTVGQGRAIPEGDPFYFDSLENTANRHIRGDFLGEAMLRGATDEEIAAMLDTPAGVEYRRRMEWDESVWSPAVLPYASDDASLLHYRTNKIRNLRDMVDTYLPNDVPIPTEILTRHGMPVGTDLHTLVSAVELSKAEFEQILAGSGRPLRTIHGHEWEAETRSVGEKVAAAQQQVWEQFMVKPETRMGSNPAAVSFYRKAVGARARILAEQGVVLDADALDGLLADARREAMTQAFQTVYHIDRNRRWTRVAGNVTAFPAAYANAITRYTRLALENPGRAAMASQFIESGLNPESWWWSGNGPDALQVQDAEGNIKDPNEPVKDGDRILIAMPEWLKQMLPPGVGEGFTINPQSLALFGQKPSIHPYVGSVATQVISQEELEAAIGKESADALFPYGMPKPGVNLETALPGWLAGATSEFDITAAEINRQFTADLIQWERAGAKGEPPTFEESQARLQRGAWYRFLSKWASPPGLSPTKPGSLAMAQYRAIQAKYEGDQDKVQAEWSRQFPNVPAPLSTTEYGTYGYIPATRSAKDTLTEHQGLVRAVAGLDPALVSVLTAGDTGEFDGTISTWLRETSYAPGAPTYLSDKSMEEASADRQRADGWKMYQQAKASYDMALASRGLSSRQKAAEPMRRQWEQWLQDYGAYNPAWFNDYRNGISTKAPGVISVMRAATSDRAFMDAHQDNTTWETASWWLQGYESAKAAYARATTTDERNLIIDQFDQWTASNLLTRGDGFKRLYDTYLDDGRSLVGGGF